MFLSPSEVAANKWSLVYIVKSMIWSKPTYSAQQSSTYTYYILFCIREKDSGLAMIFEGGTSFHLRTRQISPRENVITVGFKRILGGEEE